MDLVRNRARMEHGSNPCYPLICDRISLVMCSAMYAMKFVRSIEERTVKKHEHFLDPATDTRRCVHARQKHDWIVDQVYVCQLLNFEFVSTYHTYLGRCLD